MFVSQTQKNFNACAKLATLSVYTADEDKVSIRPNLGRQHTLTASGKDEAEVNDQNDVLLGT